ncbi:hypothetical protein P8452_32732 [Trifolium repens]|nr:hypothetical protein P8452_32732 [Trifolium repens]
MNEELRSIEKNNTWDLYDLPSDKKAIDVKWVYKAKQNPEGKIIKYKARLIAKGFLQKQGLNYDEVFSPVARHETIWLVIALACSKRWPLFHLDVKSTFLNGPLEEDVYVKQPPGFELKGKDDKVLKLHKALYGLKQVKIVDDNTSEAVDSTMFRQLVETLRYLCQSRPNISYVVGYISRFMSKPLKSHFLATKRILRYINGTIHYGVLFPYSSKRENLELVGFSDADWCGDKVERKSTSGYLFKFQGAPVSWCSKKQPIIALSSCEAEYVAGSLASCQANCLQST